MKSITVLIALLGACALTPTESEDASDIVSTVGNDPNLPPPPPQTTLTFYADANYSGASYSVSLLPATSAEGTLTVTGAELSAHGLFGNVSSVRLYCGERASHVSLFSIDWSEFSRGTTLECQPYHGAAVNLGTIGYDNRITAAALVAHTVSGAGFSYSAFFDQIWHDHLLDVPDGVTAGTSEIWLESWHSYRIYQHFTLSHLGCSDRDAAFDLRVSVSTASGQPRFATTITSVWVSYGFGDAWGCHDGMLAKLQAGAQDAANQLDTSLPGFVLGVAGITSSPTYYFMPDDSTRSFEIYYAD